MATELILLDNVKDLGNVGDIVKVADGYARNFLLPRGIAERVTKSALRKVESRKIALQKEYEENLNIAKAVAAKISGIELDMPMEANEDGKLYGSVTDRLIAEKIAAQTELEINAHNVVLADPVRQVGTYKVEIDLHPEVRSEVTVNVTAAE